MRGAQVQIGDRYGRLTVVSPAEPTPAGRIRWTCRCDCGASHVASSHNMRSGNVQSCGCLPRERAARLNRTHGEAFRHTTPEYIAWCSMKQRCFDERSAYYANYGGRGITVCARWRDSYEAFLADMGRKPSARHSLDRINNDGNYQPGNCRWATAKQQANNRRPPRKS